MPYTATSATPATVQNNMFNHAKQSWTKHFQDWKQAITMFWKNGRGFTPTQMAAQFGTSAVGVFAASARTAAYLSASSADPNLFDAATNTAQQAQIRAVLALIGNYTPNADGSITVAAAPAP